MTNSIKTTEHSLPNLGNHHQRKKRLRKLASDVIQSLTVKQLRTGKYVSGEATESTGYVIIKDEDGDDRKLMVQA